jgi:hypothetical protein
VRPLNHAGALARTILRWRFAGFRTVKVNGRVVPALRTANGISIEFDHTDKAVLRGH